MRINVKNTAAIQAALDAVNGRATADTIHRAREVADMAAMADKRLATMGVLKRQSPGTILHWQSGQAKSAAYKGRSYIATRVSLERGVSGWFMTDCQRAEPFRDHGGHAGLVLSETERESVMARLYASATTLPC